MHQRVNIILFYYLKHFPAINIWGSFFSLWRNECAEAREERRRPSSRVIREVTLGMRDRECRDIGVQSLRDEAAPGHHGHGSSPVCSGHRCMKVKVSVSVMVWLAGSMGQDASSLSQPRQSWACPGAEGWLSGGLSVSSLCALVGLGSA